MATRLDAEIRRFETAVKRGDYDNLRNVLLEARTFWSRLPSGRSSSRTILEGILVSATTAAHQLVRSEPAMTEYLEGLIDEGWLAKPKPRKKRKPAKSRAKKKR